MKSKIVYLIIILLVAFFAFTAGRVDFAKHKTSVEVNPAYKDAGINYSLDKATIETERFRDKYPGEIQTHLFNKEIIQKILNQPECYGIYLINIINDKGERDILIAGSNKDQHSIIKLSNGEYALVGGGGTPCPPPTDNDQRCP